MSQVEVVVVEQGGLAVAFGGDQAGNRIRRVATAQDVLHLVLLPDGGPQPDRCPSHQLLTVLSSHAGKDVDAVWAAAKKAVEDGRLRHDADAAEKILERRRAPDRIAEEHDVLVEDFTDHLTP